MNQDAVLPSFTDSTGVSATPPISPPQNMPSAVEAIVFGSTSGTPHRFNPTGDRASLTKIPIQLIKCMINENEYLTLLIM